MANKTTVTMYHPKASESLEVMPNEVKNTETSGWTTEKPVILKVNGVKIPEATASFKEPIEPKKPKKKDSNQSRS